MQSTQKDRDKDKSIYTPEKKIHFPDGLPAFETVKDFLVIANEEESPFLWLQASNVPNLAFITIDPFLVFPAYRPDISDSDVTKLDIKSEEDTFILSIVTVRNEPQSITTNLVSPIVINWKTQTGKQVILNNHREYSVNYRIDDLTTDNNGNVVNTEEQN